MTRLETEAYHKGINDACAALEREHARRKSMAGRRPDSYDEGSIDALEDAKALVSALSGSTNLVGLMYGT